MGPSIDEYGALGGKVAAVALLLLVGLVRGAPAAELDGRDAGGWTLLLESESLEVRIEAERRLGSAGAEALPLLGELASSGSVAARRLSAGALAARPVARRGALPALLALAKDPDREVRRLAGGGSR